MARPAPVLDSFIWGANGEAMTPEQIARQREIAAALGQQGIDTSPVASWTQGAARVADALAGVVKERRANSAESANTAANSSIMQSLLGGGATGFPAAPPLAPTGSGTLASAAGASIPQSASAQAIRDGLIKRGLPEHVADGFLMNYQDESGLNPGINEQNPTVAGSRGGFGLAQWTGPRRKALEAFAAQQGKPASDLDTQLDFTMSELQGPEAAAYQAIQAAPDAGSAAAAIVNKFLRPAEEHRVAREKRYLGAGSAPVQVASLDPSVGMPPAPDSLATMPPGTAAVAYDPSGLPPLDPNDPMAPVPQPSALGPYTTVKPASSDAPPVAGDPSGATPSGQAFLSRMTSPKPIGGVVQALTAAPQAAQATGKPQGAGTPGEIRQGADGKNYQYAQTTGMAGATGDSGWIETSMAPQGSQQVAQAQDLSQIPVEAGGTLGALPQGQAQRGINPAIIEALSNPAASEQTRKIAGMLLAQQIDPNAGLDAEYKRAQIDALRAKANAGEESVFGTPIYGKDPKTGEVVLGAIGKNGTFHRLDTGGVTVTPGVTWQDMGTYRQGFDKSGAAATAAVPIDNSGKASDTAAGKGEGEARVTYESMSSKMPGLEQVVGQLDDLAGKATYTNTGQLLDWGRKEIGMDPRESAIARTNYIAMVNNQILPMLRDTFGSQFTEREGETLRETMGDPNKSPAEKQTVLKAFIEQKRRDVAALAAQTGQGDAPAGKKRLKFNPSTGELE